MFVERYNGNIMFQKGANLAPMLAVSRYNDPVGALKLGRHLYLNLYGMYCMLATAPKSLIVCILTKCHCAALQQ